MAEIGQFDKVTNLWPTPPSRPVEKSGSRDQSSQKKHRDNTQQHKKEDN